jgi:signal transduction histidine kinase
MKDDLTFSRTQFFWLLQISGWLGWLVVFGMRDVFSQQAIGGIDHLLLDASAGFCLTTCLRWLYQKIWRSHLTTRLTMLFLGSALAAVIWQPIKNYPQIAYFNEVQALYEFGLSAYFAGVLSYSFVVLLGWSFLYFGLKSYLQLEEERRFRTTAEAMAIESQLQMLRYQVNPHFLFNTLNAISTLVLTSESHRAHAMLQRLSEFLRYTLQSEGETLVPLNKELDAIRSYLAIESVRFGDRLQFQISVSQEASNCAVPSLILQPLVENAFKHGLSKSSRNGLLQIVGELQDEDVVLKVRDNGPGFGDRSAASGVGLRNTERRLALHYPQAWSLTCDDLKTGGAEVMLRFTSSPQEVAR